MKRFLLGLAIVLAVGGGIAWFGDRTSGPDLAESFCSDLKAGYTPVQILQASGDDPQTMADRAFGYAAIACPDQLEDNDTLRTYLEAWGIDPDA